MFPDQIEFILQIIKAIPKLAKALVGIARLLSAISQSAVWRHLTGSIRRWREGIRIWSWECIGGIIYNLATRKQIEQMEDVPYPLYERALAMAQSASDRYPRFDQRVFAPDWTYRMVATIEGDTHVLVFYRRPKFWPLP